MDQQLLQQAADCFGIAAQHLTPLLGGNFSQVYEYVKHGQGYVLRITPPDGGIDLAGMQATLAWMQFLSAFGVDVVLPVRSRQRKLVEVIEWQGSSFLISAVEKAGGVLAETLALEQWSDELYQALGQVTGRMHALAMCYIPQGAEYRRPEWNHAENCFNPGEEVDQSQPLVQAQRRLVLEAVRSLPKTIDGYGLIHADLHCANYFVDPAAGKVTIFDFDDCAYGWYGMDIAMLALDMSNLYGEACVEPFLIQFLRGYLKEKSIDAFWISRLPVLLKLLETGLYAQLYRHADTAEPDTWVGRFMQGRRERIEAGIPFLALDFERILAAAARSSS
jgi:Ser/Thr protein kinase RdoA (MazF antagonist)